MADIKIGPSTLGPVDTAEKVLENYHNKGMKHCEIAYTYGVYIKDEKDAQRIGKKAKELKISLTIHAPYFVNLNSDDEEKLKRSKERILSCCANGEILGVTKVVFHPGFYGNNYRKQSDEKKEKIRQKAYDNIKEAIIDMQETIKDNGWNVKLAPEVMGKVNVFGSPEEISRLVKDTGCSFCIDFAHVLAREKTVNFKKIKDLFPQKSWHVHFSGIEYTDVGERNHIPLKDDEWKNLFLNLPKDKEITIACESPDPEKGAVDGVRILSSLKKKA